MGWAVAGGTLMMDGTSETSTRRRGSSTVWTSEEVCDLVFGEYTKDGPTPRRSARMDSHISHPWEYWFEGDRPDWYLPWPPPSYPAILKP